jgi:hypothetical protein
MFFALEQEAKLNMEYPGWRRIMSFNFWYGWLSRYGTNAARPMYALLILGVLCAITYAVMCSPVLGASYRLDWDLMRRSVLFSLQQICTPFVSLRELKSPIPNGSDVHFLLGLLAIFESLAAVVLITLTVLALRWEFKRG